MTATAIPTLTTERLVMRAWRLDDIPAATAFFASQRAAFVGGPLDARTAWRRVAYFLGHWRLLGFGGWALEERATGRLVGTCGLFAPHGKPEPELGWIAFEGGEGRGLMTEAARAVIAHARERLGWTRLVSYVTPTNERSVALARRLGAQDEGVCEAYAGPGEERPHHTFAHDLGAGEAARTGEATPLSSIPTLVGERIALRPLGLDDLAPFAAFYADPSASRFVGGPADAVAVWRRLASYLGHWDLRGYGPFAMVEREGGAFLGYTGHWCPEGWPEPEILWGLMPHAQGRGLATEGAALALRHAYEALGWTTAISAVDPANTPSRAVAERLGATREKTIEMSGFTADIFRHRPPASVLAA